MCAPAFFGWLPIRHRFGGERRKPPPSLVTGEVPEGRRGRTFLLPNVGGGGELYPLRHGAQRRATSPAASSGGGLVREVGFVSYPTSVWRRARRSHPSVTCKARDSSPQGELYLCCHFDQVERSETRGEIPLIRSLLLQDKGIPRLFADANSPSATARDDSYFHSPLSTLHSNSKFQIPNSKFQIDFHSPHSTL